MHFSTIFTASALAGAAVAADHKIAVSTQSGDLIFKPDTLDAAKGDTVTFRFWPKNHSVAQSAFASPCSPMANGLWSGFVPTTSTSSVANWTYQFEITNASAPIWFYCSQGRHCQSGMVGVINPPKTGDRNLAAYKSAAASAQANVSPNSRAGTGGKLIENSTAGASPSASASGSSGTGSSASASGSAPAQSTGGAAQLAGSATFAGLGLVAYLLI